MLTIKNKTHDLKLNNIHLYYEPTDILIFDIETTGFIVDKTKLYMIGCAYYEAGKWQIVQWFNNDGNSEQEIIERFFGLLRDYKYVLNYNGDGFDIPYLTNKATALGIASPFFDLESIDLYKQIKSLKRCLYLDNLKQKTIEGFLSINRLDKYSGADLIKVYRDYLKTGHENLKTLLIQHNYEDIEGLICCFSMLSYLKLKAGCLHVSKMSVIENKFILTIKLDYPLPRRITVGAGDIAVTAFQNEGSITIPILSCQLYFFFEDYREYYYLPAEDMAIHKSVARYVDKDYRERAKKENCYLKKEGHFISQLNEGIISGYKRSYNDKETYIELADSFLKDMDMVNAYARHVIKSAMQ